MKRFFFILAVLLAAQSAAARTYPYLSFQKSDGTLWSVGAESLQMTFEDGMLHVANGSESCDLEVKDLVRMFFSDTSMTGIEKQASSVRNGPVLVYTASGILVGRYADMQDFRRNSAKGVYVVKGNGTTIKTVVK